MRFADQLVRGAATRHLLLVLAVIAPPALARDRTVTITSFDRIRVEGSFQVEVTTGKGPSARVSGSEQAIERTIVVNQGQTLVVRPNPNAWGGWDGADAGPIVVRLTTPGLRAAALTGSGALKIDAMRNATVSVALEGSGSLDVAAVDTDALDVGIAGAGTITLAGRAAGARFAVRGTSNLRGEKLSARDARVIAEGAGDITLAAVRTADVAASGAGRVTIIGNPACTVSNRGNGSVSCGKGRR